jgi:hypothetical protein
MAVPSCLIPVEQSWIVAKAAERRQEIEVTSRKNIHNVKIRQENSGLRK